MSTPSQLLSLTVTEDEPPLKKFKTLFEASDPDRITHESYDGMGGSSESQDPTQTPGILSITSNSNNPPRLAVVREEEEDSQTTESLVHGGQKRKARSLSADDLHAQLSDVEKAPQDPPRPKTKRRMLDGLDNDPSEMTRNPIRLESGETRAKSGAATGRPDRDEAFLKALASTKRGKKAEDSFDREFNKLKIFKPDLNREEEQEEIWSLLNDFEDERDIRGNFMVIMEMDVHRKSNDTPRQVKDNSSALEWQLRANFKKFKKVR